MNIFIFFFVFTFIIKGTLGLEGVNAPLLVSLFEDILDIAELDDDSRFSESSVFQKMDIVILNQMNIDAIMSMTFLYSTSPH